MPAPNSNLTGQSRYRVTWLTGKLILQVEEKRYGSPIWNGKPTMYPVWRDARMSDMYALNYLQTKNR